jgi:hypothetical protein
MNGRRWLTVLGTGLSTTLVVAVLGTTVLQGPIEFSVIVGLPVGVVVGLVALGATAVLVDRFDSLAGAALGGYAGFGYAVVGCLLLRYVDVAGARRALGLREIVVIAVLVGAVAFVGFRYVDREGTR